MRRRLALTRVEVAVVMAIVMVFAAGLFLFIGAVRSRMELRKQSPRQASCSNNLMVIGKAMSTYSADYGNYWPAHVDNLAAAPGAAGLHGLGDSEIHPDYNRSLALIYPEYMPQHRVFRCPATRDEPNVLHAVVELGEGGAEMRVSGFSEPGSTTPLTAADAYRGRRKTALAKYLPSYGYDARISPRAAQPDTAVMGDMDGSAVAYPRAPWANHWEGQNVAFFDGSVRWATTNYASGERTDNIYQPGWTGTASDGRPWGADTDVYLNVFADDATRNAAPGAYDPAPRGGR